MKDKEELLLEKAGEEGNADAKYKIKVEVSISGEEMLIDNCPGSHGWRFLDFCVEVDVFDKEANYVINKLESYPDGIPSEIIEKDSNNAIAEVLDAIICEKSHKESTDFFNYFILSDCKYKIISCIPI